MKYCRVCKLRAGEGATVCEKCGGGLATLSLTPPPAAGDTAAADNAAATPTALGLQGQIAELKAAHQHQLRRRNLWGLICAAVVCVLLLTGYQIYARSVLSYAILQDVQISQAPQAENLVQVSFQVVQPGKVVFDRESGGKRTEKIDVFTQAGPARLSWAWPADRQTGIDVRVRYRTGWTTAQQREHLAISGKTRSVDIVFLLDTTASMEPYIEGLKQKCIDFAQIVSREGHDIRLGLLGFGDLQEGEMMYVLNPTADLQNFQTRVGKVPRTSGGDLPESGVEALREALELPVRRDALVCFVHITDAPCHHEQQLGPLSVQLKKEGVVTYVVSRQELRSLYQGICVNGGKFYAIEDAEFADILLRVARSITSQIGYR